MAGQKTISSTYQPPLPTPPPIMPISGTFSKQTPPSNCDILLNFTNPMSPHIPNASHFVIKFDGANVTVLPISGWDTDKRFFVQCGPWGPDITMATISYDGLDPNFKSVASEPVAAFTDFALTAF